MAGFTKLHPSLLSSSVWSEPDNVRIVWITMLAMADIDGNVRASLGGLSHQSRKSIGDTQAALAVLEAPDKDSTRPNEDGRRVLKVEGGWKLVNHQFYRELGMSDAAKGYWREAKRRQREEKAGAVSMYSKGFEKFWEMYPRKTGKGAAWKFWDKAIKYECGEDVLIGKVSVSLAWQVKSEQWVKDNGAYIPHPATYLNQHRWKDEPMKPTRARTDKI